MKKAFFCLVTLVTLNLLATTPVQADGGGQPQGFSVEIESERLPLARQLVTLLLPNVGRDAMDGLKAGVMTHLDTVKDPAVRAGLERDIDASMVAAAPIMGRHMAELTEAFALAYARQYDSEELRQIIAFSQSPAGRHFLTQNEALDGDPTVLAVQEKMMADVSPVFASISRKLCTYQAGQRAGRGDHNANCAAA